MSTTSGQVAVEVDSNSRRQRTDRTRLHLVFYACVKIKNVHGIRQIPGKIEKDYLTQVPRLSDRFKAITKMHAHTHSPHLSIIVFVRSFLRPRMALVLSIFSEWQQFFVPSYFRRSFGSCALPLLAVHFDLPTLGVAGDGQWDILTSLHIIIS